jgi:hypothetical protein
MLDRQTNKNDPRDNHHSTRLATTGIIGQQEMERNGSGWFDSSRDAPDDNQAPHVLSVFRTGETTGPVWSK